MRKGLNPHHTPPKFEQEDTQEPGTRTNAPAIDLSALSFGGVLLSPFSVLDGVSVAWRTSRWPGPGPGEDTVNKMAMAGPRCIGRGRWHVYVNNTYYIERINRYICKQGSDGAGYTTPPHHRAPGRL